MPNFLIWYITVYTKKINALEKLFNHGFKLIV